MIKGGSAVVIVSGAWFFELNACQNNINTPTESVYQVPFFSLSYSFLHLLLAVAVDGVSADNRGSATYQTCCCMIFVRRAAHCRSESNSGA